MGLVISSKSECMKTKFAYILITIGLFASCTNDPNWGECAQTVDFQEEIVTKQNSVCITVTFLGDIADAINQVKIAFSQDSTLSDAKIFNMSYSNRQATVSLSILESEATYYVRYILSPEHLRTTRTSSFQAINRDLPSVETLPAYNLTPTSATLPGKADENGSYAITDKGVIYTLVLNDPTWHNRVSCQSQEQSFYAEAENLRAGATYYFFAYATNRNGTAYGDTLSFTTPKTY